MSTSCVPYAIIAAMLKAEDFLGAGRLWHPFPDDAVRAKQIEFLRLMSHRDDVALMNEIQSMASHDVDKVNRFLRDHGFSIQLDPITDDTFAVASILDVLVEWLKAGTRTMILDARGDRYDAVKIKDRQSVHVHHVPRYDDMAVSIQTLDPKTAVWMMMCDDELEHLDLIDRTQVVRSAIAGNAQLNEHDGVIFPMVAMDHEVDISWLRGVNTTAADGEPAWISQALQQTKFRMNERGARAESAVAMAVTRSISFDKLYTIDRPFLVWIERECCSLPLFAARINPEDWKDPGSLD